MDTVSTHMIEQNVQTGKKIVTTTYTTGEIILAHRGTSTISITIT